MRVPRRSPRPHLAVHQPVNRPRSARVLRTIARLVLMAVLATTAVLAQTSAAEASCTSYVAGPDGAIVGRGQLNESTGTYTPDVIPNATWNQVSSMIWDASGASVPNGEFVFISPGINFKVCGEGIYFSDGSSANTSTWSNVIYTQFGTGDDGFERCWFGILQLGWGIGQTFCHNFYANAGIVPVVDIGPDATLDPLDPDDIELVDLSVCVSSNQASQAANALTNWVYKQQAVEQATTNLHNASGLEAIAAAGEILQLAKSQADNAETAFWSAISAVVSALPTGTTVATAAEAEAVLASVMNFSTVNDLTPEMLDFAMIAELAIQRGGLEISHSPHQLDERSHLDWLNEACRYSAFGGGFAGSAVLLDASVAPHEDINIDPVGPALECDQLSDPKGGGPVLGGPGTLGVAVNICHLTLLSHVDWIGEDYSVRANDQWSYGSGAAAKPDGDVVRSSMIARILPNRTGDFEAAWASVNTNDVDEVRNAVDDMYSQGIIEPLLINGWLTDDSAQLELVIDKALEDLHTAGLIEHPDVVVTLQHSSDEDDGTAAAFTDFVGTYPDIPDRFVSYLVEPTLYQLVFYVDLDRPDRFHYLPAGGPTMTYDDLRAVLVHEDDHFRQAERLRSIIRDHVPVGIPAVRTDAGWYHTNDDIWRDFEVLPFTLMQTRDANGTIPMSGARKQQVTEICAEINCGTFNLTGFGTWFDTVDAGQWNATDTEFVPAVGGTLTTAELENWLFDA